MQSIITISTNKHQELVDITREVVQIVSQADIKDGTCTIYVPHATAAVILNESADPNIKIDFLNAINRTIPERAGYLHDRIDMNAAAHIKAALIGPSESIPIKDGDLQLGTWQSIMFCEFDGPRSTRRIIVQIS